MRPLYYSSLGILILMLFSTFIVRASAQEAERQKPQSTEVVGNNASIAPPKLEMTPATASKMAVKVKLQVGEISVDAFTEALSKQTGLTITATPSLRERKIIVQITDALASDLLTAVADMNERSALCPESA